MEDLKLEATEKTPFFSLKTSGTLQFGGISMPEDAASFYFKIMDWISDYYRYPNKITNITVSFIHLNSTSSSMIFRIFHALKRLQASGKTNISCTWFYEADDLDMKEYAEDVSELAENIAFKILATEEIESDMSILPTAV